MLIFVYVYKMCSKPIYTEFWLTNLQKSMPILNMVCPIFSSLMLTLIMDQFVLHVPQYVFSCEFYLFFQYITFVGLIYHLFTVCSTAIKLKENYYSRFHYV